MEGRGFIRTSWVAVMVLSFLPGFPESPATLTASQQATNSARCAAHIKPSGEVTFSDWQFPDTLNPYQTTRLVTREITNALFEVGGRYRRNV